MQGPPGKDQAVAMNRGERGEGSSKRRLGKLYIPLSALYIPLSALYIQCCIAVPQSEILVIQTRVFMYL
jgi:hypothetical protein